LIFAVAGSPMDKVSTAETQLDLRVVAQLDDLGERLQLSAAPAFRIVVGIDSGCLNCHRRGSRRFFGTSMKSDIAWRTSSGRTGLLSTFPTDTPPEGGRPCVVRMPVNCGNGVKIGDLG
jgi:hypothetical protein